VAFVTITEMSKKDYTISKSRGDKMWTCKVTDSYGNVSINYFKNVEECSKNIYYVWDNEDNKADKDDLMSKAVEESIRMDMDRGIEPCLD